MLHNLYKRFFTAPTPAAAPTSTSTSTPTRRSQITSNPQGFIRDGVEYSWPRKMGIDYQMDEIKDAYEEFKRSGEPWGLGNRGIETVVWMSQEETWIGMSNPSHGDSFVWRIHMSPEELYLLLVDGFDVWCN